MIVPPQAHNCVIKEAHAAHIGITSLTRLFAWWLKMDADLEAKVRSCSTCHYKCIGITHLRQCFTLGSGLRSHGPGFMLITLVLFWEKCSSSLLTHTPSGWRYVHITNSATSAITINKMRSSLATFGLPEILVTDNWTNFTNAEFEEIFKANGIQHTKQHHITLPPMAWSNMPYSLSSWG